MEARVERMVEDLAALAAVGTDAAAGRDLVAGWMRSLGLDVQVDQVGTVVGTRAGTDATSAPVMIGGRLDPGDGAIGVVAGLEVLRALVDAAAVRTRRPVAVAVLAAGAGRELPPAAAFVELQVESGPRLWWDGRTIGVVTGVEGVSQQELTLTAGSDHQSPSPAPPRLRHDPAFVAGAVVTFVRRLSADVGWDQIGTVGRLALEPDRVDTVATTARLSVDLRNPDDATLTESEERLVAFTADMANAEGVTAEWRRLARSAPVAFDPAVAARVGAAAEARGHSAVRLAAETGHAAERFASACPTGMILVPRRATDGGRGPGPVDPHDLRAGTDVLLDVVVDLAS